MRPFWISFFLAALVVVVWIWFGRRVLSYLCQPITRQVKVADKRIVTAARVGGLTARRREIAFLLPDETTLTLAVSRRVFEDCPHRARGLLTVRGGCFQCFEEDGADGVTVGRPVRKGSS